MIVGTAALIAGAPLALPAASASGAVHGKGNAARSKLARLRTYPSKCLRQDGFGHIKAIRSTLWQGTTGQEPRTKLNDSAFVQGPFRSDRLANLAAKKARRIKIAYAGGPFIVTATRASYLQQETSLAAACLARLTDSGGYRF